MQKIRNPVCASFFEVANQAHSVPQFYFRFFSGFMFDLHFRFSWRIICAIHIDGEVQAMNRVVCSLLVLSAFVGSQLPTLLGQTTSTEVTGIVSDSSGLPILKADVTLTRIDTAEARRELTNQQGISVFRL